MVKGSALGKKISTLVSEKAAKAGAKSAASVSTALIADIAFVTIGGITGFMDAANLFEVSKNQVDWKMRAISALLNGFLSSSIGSWIDIALLVLQLITGVDARKWSAEILYKYISNNIDFEEEYIDDDALFEEEYAAACEFEWECETGR